MLYYGIILGAGIYMAGLISGFIIVFKVMKITAKIVVEGDLEVRKNTEQETSE